MITATKGKHRYLCSRKLDIAEVENIMVVEKEFFIKSVECNPNVISKKTYINNNNGDEITYIKVKLNSRRDHCIVIYLNPKLKVNRRCILGEKTNYLLGAVLILATDCIEVNQNKNVVGTASPE